MHLGVINTILGSDNLEESFQLAAKVGAEGVEIFYKSPNGRKVLGEPGHARTLKTLAEKYNVRITSLALIFLCAEPSLISGGSVVARAQADISLAMDVAVEVGAGVVLVPFFGKNKIEQDAELNAAIESLQPLVEQAEEKGVTIGVESTLNRSQNQAMMDGLSSERVRTYYDVGNVMARKLDPADGIRQLGAQALAMIHVKDVKLTEGAPPDFNVPLGGGNVQFRGVAQALKAVGYDGWIILETPPGDDAVASAKVNLDYARAIFAQG